MNMRFSQIQRCRLCGDSRPDVIMELGEQYLTGVFPKTPGQPLTKGPLTLSRCPSCGLVQLLHSYDLNELYGNHYGYRSSLNRSMVAHLQAKAAALLQLAQPGAGDCIIDIGSNDGTLLSFYPEKTYRLVGFDPAGDKFRRYYRADIELVADFFSAKAFLKRHGGRKAGLVTSIAMFYDLENPLQFMQEVESILADDGIWHFEQSYLLAMLRTNAYDTICHEHLEYYAVRQIKWMTDRAGLKIIRIETNEINGGSFAVTVAKKGAAFPEDSSTIQKFLTNENKRGLYRSKTYEDFKGRIFMQRTQFLATLNEIRTRGKKVLGYGASTKGNVILQFCGITQQTLPYIAEVNQDKFGSFTPGTNIPIISEQEAHAMKPDYFLVLPWHFKSNLVQREAAFLRGGGRMIFPLPELHIVGAEILCT